MTTKSLITNPADTAVLDDIAAQEAAGGDPFGDNEEIVAVTVADQAAAAASELAAAAGMPDAVDEPDDADPPVEGAATTADATADPVVAEPAAAVEPSAAPAPAPVPQFRTASQEAIAADTAALNAEKAEALQKMMDGDLEPAAYAAIDATVTQKLGQLLVQSTLAELNAQTAAQTETQAVLALMDRSAAAKQLDYRADATAQAQFDMMLNALGADPANAGLAYPALLDKAHAAVLAVRGIAAATTAAPPPAPLTGKPPARTPEAAPLTLRGLPVAQVPLTGGTAADALGRLTGAEYQTAFDKLTPAQQAAMVDD